MRGKKRFTLVVALAWVLLLLAIAGTVALVLADMPAADRTALAALMADRVPSLVVAALFMLVVVFFVVRAVWRGYVVSLRHLAEDARIIGIANPQHRATPAGAREVRTIAQAINALADANAALKADVAQQVRDANARIEQERSRLAALMSELAQSVLMCNTEGRILLYNARAMQLLRKPLDSAADTGKAVSLVGLGRSVFAIFDRNLIVHALESIQDRMRQGTRPPVANFVTTAPGGQLVRVQLAPVVSAVQDGADAGGAVDGFVLLLDNITRRIESGARRDQLLHALTQGTRAPLANMRAAVETIAAFPDMERAAQERFIGIIGEEARTLSTRLDASVRDFADSLRTEWPLEDMRGADLIAAARRRIEGRLPLPTKLETVDESVWLQVDSYSLMQGLTYLVARLHDEFGIREIRFALHDAGTLAHLDLVWTGAPLSFETQTAWQTDSMALGGEACPLTLAQIIARHDGEMWYQIDKPAQREYFRIALPKTRPEETPWSFTAAAESRPEFYDFDLFHQPGQTPELDGMPLTALAYTVFDSETTGLEPAKGDEIVSLGAVRVVNGRLLEQEAFEQLVDPRRPMSPEAAKITGIDDAMLENQPTIDKVLPAFATFCEDTVLVAHNAAFDLRFLNLKERATGVRFTQPVLDTLLLSAVIHPDLPSHGLTAIAERMGVNPIGRHTALGDAIMTAEVFLRMIPLLAQQGIRTLGEARAASQRTYFARIEY
ncbi:MAG: exonuclease domain-containing protein [Burkholderiales bacterium]